MSDYHEPVEEMQPKDRNFVRALTSLKEEIEAINWYHQRVATCKEEDLRVILAHNRDEEIEHACMTLEWLRRNMPGWNEEMKTYFFKEGDITALEEQADSADETESGDLGIGSLKN